MFVQQYPCPLVKNRLRKRPLSCSGVPTCLLRFTPLVPLHGIWWRLCVREKAAHTPLIQSERQASSARGSRDAPALTDIAEQVPPEPRRTSQRLSRAPFLRISASRRIARARTVQNKQARTSGKRRAHILMYIPSDATLPPSMSITRAARCRTHSTSRHPRAAAPRCTVSRCSQPSSAPSSCAKSTPRPRKNDSARACARFVTNPARVIDPSRKRRLCRAASVRAQRAIPGSSGAALADSTVRRAAREAGRDINARAA